MSDEELSAAAEEIIQESRAACDHTHDVGFDADDLAEYRYDLIQEREDEEGAF